MVYNRKRGRMHHTLRIYRRYRELFLRYYIFQSSWTKLPLVGRLVRWVANTYGNRAQSAYVLSPDEAAEIIDISQGVALGPCTCRAVFRNCDSPIGTEIMLGLSRHVFLKERPKDYREISQDTAKEIMRECHRRGLVHTIIRCRHDFYAICNCCACCCVPLRLAKNYGIANALKRSPDIIRQFRERQAL
ncbi:MAG: ferredoxin-like protein [Chloroflexota bacterium]